MLKDGYNELAEALPDQANLAIDETPLKRGRMKTWLWAFVFGGYAGTNAEPRSHWNQRRSPRSDERRRNATARSDQSFRLERRRDAQFHDLNFLGCVGVRQVTVAGGLAGVGSHVPACLAGQSMNVLW